MCNGIDSLPVRFDLLVYKSIMKTIGSCVPESGGIIGCSAGIITDFFYDKNAKTSCSTYYPSKDVISVISKWKESGISFSGFIHSHPRGCNTLSNWDIKFARQLLQYNNMHSVIMGIVSDDLLLLYQVKSNVSIPMRCTVRFENSVVK